MTTPPTPAGWYPDTEVPGGLRYWDGSNWTEHRTPPAAVEPAPVPASEQPTSVTGLPEQPTSVVSLPDQPTSVVSLPDQPATGAPEQPAEQPAEEPAAAPAGESAQPATDGPAAAQPTWEPPPLPAWGAPPAGPDQAAGPPSYSAPPTTPYEAPSYEAPVTQAYGTPSYGTPSYGAPSYGAPSYETPQFAPPPPGSPPGGQFGVPPGVPPGGGSSNKLVLGIIGALVAVALVVVLVLVYFFVIKHDDKTTTAAGSSTSQSKPSSTKTSTSVRPSTQPSTPQGNGGGVTDGNLTITFSRTDTGDTITSSISDSLEVTAKGEYLVVYFDVTNNGTSSQTMLLTQQKLNAGGQSFDADAEANFYLSGAATVEIQPGDTQEVGVVFDVPVGTEPDSVQVFGSVTSSGVTLPIS